MLRQLSDEQRGQGRLLEQLAKDQKGQHKWVDEVAGQQRGQGRLLEQLAKDQKGQHKWLVQLADHAKALDHLLSQASVAVERQTVVVRELEEGLRGHGEWTRALQSRMQGLAHDVREGVAGSGLEEETLPEPRVVEPRGYEKKLAKMGAQLKANLGCGEKPLSGYINIDIQELPDVDVVADVRRMPFESGTVVELASFHLAEHFREHHFRKRVLPYWRDLLVEDGVLRIVCPNWRAMLERLNEGKMSLADFTLITFGAQDYAGDDHFAMYTPETLSALLEDTGFRDIEVLVAERMNDICPEMELLARR